MSSACGSWQARLAILISPWALPVTPFSFLPSFLFSGKPHRRPKFALLLQSPPLGSRPQLRKTLALLPNPLALPSSVGVAPADSSSSQTAERHRGGLARGQPSPASLRSNQSVHQLFLEPLIPVGLLYWSIPRRRRRNVASPPCSCRRAPLRRGQVSLLCLSLNQREHRVSVSLPHLHQAPSRSIEACSGSSTVTPPCFAQPSRHGRRRPSSEP